MCGRYVAARAISVAFPPQPRSAGLVERGRLLRRRERRLVASFRLCPRGDHQHAAAGSREPRGREAHRRGVPARSATHGPLGRRARRPRDAQQRARRLPGERDRRARRDGRLPAHDGRLHRGQRAGTARAALPRALSRDAGDAAHGRQPRPNHQRQRSVARDAGLPARGSARPHDHRIHGQGDAGDARRRPVGRRHRDGRARERAAHVRDEIRRGPRGRGVGDRRSRSERRRGRAARGIEGRNRAQSRGAPAARRVRGERAAARRARTRARLPPRGSAGRR